MRDREGPDGAVPADGSSADVGRGASGPGRDPRGWAERPFEAAGLAPGDARAVHVVSVEPGAVRGNHRHPHTTEWMLVFGGGADVAVREGDGEVRVTHVDGGPTTLVFPPGVAHAVRGRGPGPAYLVCWADGEPETERVEPLLESSAAHRGHGRAGGA